MKTTSKKMELVESYGQNKHFIKIMAKNGHFPCILVRLAECAAHGQNVLKNQKYFVPGFIIPLHRSPWLAFKHRLKIKFLEHPTDDEPSNSSQPLYNLNFPPLFL